MADEKVEERSKEIIGEVDKLEGQLCPICKKKSLTLMQREMEIPYFGIVYLFSMVCDNCKYHKSDVEPANKGKPTKYTLEVSSDDDLNVRVVKSSTATVKIPHITTITPGPASNGYVTNVEGILKRVKHQIEELRENEDDPATKKKAKNMLKKIQRVLWGKEKIKLIIEDPDGNSAIISDKAEKKPL